MGATITRYAPSRHYLAAGFVALGLAGFSGWCATRWGPAIITAVLFLFSAGVVFFLALRPPISIHETHLGIGPRAIPWRAIRRVDRTGWVSPLILHLTLTGDERVLLIYPGELDSANSLLRHVRRFAREALIDGVPHRQFWSGQAQGQASKAEPLASPKYQILRPEDEAEVERLFQRLKAVGHFDPKNSPDEK